MKKNSTVLEQARSDCSWININKNSWDSFGGITGVKMIEDISGLLDYIPASIERERRVLITSTLNAMGEQDAAVRWQTERIDEKKARQFVSSCKPLSSFTYNIGVLINTAKQNGWLPDKTCPRKIIERKVYCIEHNHNEYKKKKYRYDLALKEYNNAPQVCLDKNNYLYKKLGLLGCLILEQYCIDIRKINGGIAYQANNGTIHKIFDNKKTFLGNGNKQVIMHPDQKFNGQYFQIGNIYNSIVVSEGLATGLTLAIFGYVVCVCICAHNIKHVVSALRKQHPASKILIATDNDRCKENTGYKETLKSGADFYSMPAENGADWNDCFIVSGYNIETTKSVFRRLINRINTST